MPHAVVSPRQRNRAKQLRRSMTRAETLLWRYLKSDHIDRLGFRRQVPIGRYIADFICHSRQIVIEIDGETHDFDSQQDFDRQRDAWFASEGFAVLRFTNDDVMKNLEGVVEIIRSMAQTRPDPPSLSLPHKGGGNPKTTAEQMATAQRSRRAIP